MSSEFCDLVLIFDTAGTAETAARLHDRQCNAARVAGRRFKRVDGAENVAEEVADLRDRGWTVTRCRCCK